MMDDIMPRDEVQKLADDCILAAKCMSGKDTFPTGQAILKDAARSLLAAQDEIDRLRADALAAQALLVEQAAGAISPRDVYGDGRYFRVPGFHEEGCSYKDDDLVTAAEALAGIVRALASDTGVKALAELRAERDALETAREMLGGFWAKAIAERDDALTRLAEAEGRVKAAVDAYWQLRSYSFHDDECKINKPPHFKGPCSCGLSKAIADGAAALSPAGEAGQ